MTGGYGTFVRRARTTDMHGPSWHVDHDGTGQWTIVTEQPELELRKYWNVDAVLCRCVTTYDHIPLVYLSHVPTPEAIGQAQEHFVLATGTYDSLWELFLDHARML